MVTTPCYCTRELVKDTLDVKGISRGNDLIDLVIQAAARRVERETHRYFYPELATRYFDWPNDQYADSWQLYLGDNEVISASTLASGGTTISASDYILQRADNRREPPYDSIEIKLSSSAAFSAGQTFQQSIALTALFGYNDDTQAIGTLSSSLSSSAATCAASDSSIGVGSLLTIDSERILLQDKAMVDTTQNLTNTLTANKGETTIGVGSGATFARGEVVMIGSEKMLIQEISGNNLTVVRAWDATALAAHAINDDVYALRTFTIKRGYLGTTAAAHDSADVIYVWQPPPLIADYALALALNDRRLAIASYAPDLVGQKALQELKESVYATYGRKGRVGAV